MAMKKRSGITALLASALSPDGCATHVGEGISTTAW